MRWGKEVRWQGALAELTIIVVGILLALWVEAWNEERADLRTERQYLESLLLDLERDARRSSVYLETPA